MSNTYPHGLQDVIDACSLRRDALYRVTATLCISHMYQSNSRDVWKTACPSSHALSGGGSQVFSSSSAFVSGAAPDDGGWFAVAGASTTVSRVSHREWWELEMPSGTATDRVHTSSEAYTDGEVFFFFKTYRHDLVP